VSTKTPTLVDLILCDEVRREDNGKLLILGMYLGAILVPRIPFSMPSLSFFCKWRTHGSLPTGELRLTNPAKEPIGGFQLSAGHDAKDVPDVFYMTFSLHGTKLSQTGTYTLVYKPPQGQRFRTLFSFDVGLRAGSPAESVGSV